MVTHEFSDILASMSDDDIMALVGPATWANGLRLERNGAVKELLWDQSEDHLEARVKDKGLTYRVRIAHGALRPSLACACSLRSDCPHAVAVLIAARAEALESRGAVPEWSRVLEQVLGISRERGGDPLALVIDAHDPSVAVSLIPLRRGASSAWSAKRASWLDLTATQWESVTDGLDPTHVSLLREGYRLSRESRSWHARTEVTLSSLGEHAYAWLARLVRAGVELFASVDGHEPFVLSHATWDADIDVRASEESLEMRVVARNGDQVVAHPRIDRDTGLLLLDGGMRAARIEGLKALEGFPLDRPLVVPAADVAEFRGTWLTALRRRFVMSSSDGSFDADATPQVAVVGTLRCDENSVVVRWWAEYEEGRSRSRAPLAHSMGDEAVAALADRVNRWGTSVGADLWMPLPGSGRIDPWHVPEFLSTVVDRESVDGLVWDVAQDVRAIEVSQDGMDVDVSVESAESDWFDLNVRVRVGDHLLSVREALEAIARGDDYVEARGGVWVRLDGPRIRALATLLDEARSLAGWEGEGLRLTPVQVGLYELFEKQADSVSLSASWRTRIAALRGEHSEDGLAPIPALASLLRPYQRHGHAWLTSRLSAGLGGVLADDMGLGKTVQILSAIAALRAAEVGSGPVLVVAPTSVVGVWAEQAATFTPGLRVRCVAETAARRGTTIREEAEACDIVVTSYTLVRLEAEQWREVALSGVVIDEAQAVKNPRTATYRALRDMDAPWRLAVSGTPIENSLGDLWSLLSLTCPGLLPPWEAFTQKVRRPIEGGDPDMLARLTSYVAPFILRRTKEQVATDLPDKIVDVVRVDLGKDHRHIYDQYLARERARILDLLVDPDANRMSVLASITRLRQLALDPALVEESYIHVGSAKVEYVADRLDEIVPLGHRALIFSQFTSFLARIRHVLERRGVSVVQLDGSTRNRTEVIERFRSGEAPVFLISLKAGGSGLTLTEADYVFVMDPWWNPAAEEQAIDRAHRIGQTKKVNVYRLVAADTIEAKVVELQDRKRRLISSVMNGTGASASLSAADLRGLLD